MDESAGKKKWVEPSVGKVSLSDELLAQFGNENDRSAIRPSPEREHLVKAAIKAIQLRGFRNKHFPHGIFGEPAWDVLLAIYAHEHLSRAITISQVARVSGLSGSSALRWINQLARLQLVARSQDPFDRRTAQVMLTDTGRRALDRFFEEVEISFALETAA